MDHVNLGSTGLKVSPLCLGTMMFGAWGERDHERSIQIIHQALDAGINFVDTANIYSAGESEEIVGKAIRGRRHEVVLATKVHGKMGKDPNQQGLSRKAIQQECEASLRRLGTDVIDLYQIHRPDPTTPWEETLSTLNDLVRQGKVRYLGCSTNHYDDPSGTFGPLLRAWEMVHTWHLADARGWERWASLQPPYSMLRRTMETEHFPACQRFGIGCMVWSPLEGGWLTGKYRRGAANPADSPRAKSWVGDLAQPRFERRLNVVEELLAWAARRGTPLSELALAWTLDQPAVTSTIIGPRTPEQLASCLAALALRLTDEDRAVVDRLVPPGTAVL
ncbi:MAG TPA: aldo/keto reductase [Thermoanaerobaculia bacterium]|nr:aldo/keto reductase [Thermoanaerobaculia bacterium]